jgi:hypothetical protein
VRGCGRASHEKFIDQRRNPMPTKTAALGGALLLLAAIPSARADATLTYESKQSGKNVVMIHDGMVRMVTPQPQGGGQAVSIYDSRKDRFVVLDEAKRSYLVMDKAMVSEQAKRIRTMQQQMMAQMREQMKDMPEEQRRMLEQQMAQFEQGQQGTGPKVDVRKTGKTDVVNGFRCEYYQSYIDGRLMSEACIAEAKALGLSAADYQAMKDMFAFMGHMAQAFSGTKQGSTQGFENVPGLPVRTRDPSGEVMELKKVDTGAVDPKLFQIPKDYKKTDPMGAIGRR